MKTGCQSIVILCVAFLGAVRATTTQAAEPAPASHEVDPLVKASPYGDKTVWSYSAKDPLPWAMFHPRDYGSSKIAFSAEGVTPVGQVPPPGVHPRIFFSPEDLPAIRTRIKEDRGAREAWMNVLAYCHAIKLTYDEKAEYAQPDWANGDWHIHGRTIELHRIGGYGKREDYFGLLAAGKNPEKTFGKNPSGFYFPAAIEAYRCLIEDDAQGAATLARAVETALRLEQQRRAREDKPVGPGQPPRPSTPRYAACNLGLVYDFIYNRMTPDQRRLVHDELVLLSAWGDNYGAFNNAEASRSNWATFTYWVWDLMAIEGEPGFNDLKFLGLYRGWRNFFTYSFFDSGAAYEAEGKLLFGMDAVVAFDRVAPKYGLELLSQHPLIRAHYAKFTALSVLPTQDKYAIFDILGGMGRGLCTPQDLVVAHYLYPHDATIDFVYRTTVGGDYRTLPMPGHSWNNLITCGIFATSHHPQITPENLKLPLSFFCGQRALLMTRSSWDKNATMLTMHVRGASGGHPAAVCAASVDFLQPRERRLCVASPVQNANGILASDLSPTYTRYRCMTRTSVPSLAGLAQSKVRPGILAKNPGGRRCGRDGLRLAASHEALCNRNVVLDFPWIREGVSLPSFFIPQLENDRMFARPVSCRLDCQAVACGFPCDLLLRAEQFDALDRIAPPGERRDLDLAPRNAEADGVQNVTSCREANVLPGERGMELIHVLGWNGRSVPSAIDTMTRPGYTFRWRSCC